MRKGKLEAVTLPSSHNCWGTVVPQSSSPGWLQKLQEDTLVAQSLVFFKESDQSLGTPDLQKAYI